MGRTEGRKENFIAMRIKSTKIFLEKKKYRRPEAMPKFVVVMCTTVTVLQGTRWVP